MFTLSVVQYNARQERIYREAVHNWKPGQAFPFLGQYIFDHGYGYVAFDERSAYWRRTKQEAIQAFLKDHPL